MSSLAPIDIGRLFVRPLKDGMGAMVGVLDVPASLPTEHLLPVRLNSRLWLDMERPEPLRTRVTWPEHLAESDIGHLLHSIQFRKPALPDALEIGLRSSVLPHADTSRCWVIAYGAFQHLPEHFANGGLLELRSTGLQLVDENRFPGHGISQVLREPIWGAGGLYGLAHSLDPAAYPAWVEGDRERNAKRDPLFAKFLDLSAQLGPELLYYTREQFEAREKSTSTLIRALIAEAHAERPNISSALPRPTGR